MIDYNDYFYPRQIKKNLKKNFLTVGWGSKKTQNIRFENIYKYFKKENFSVLDVGCGLGDFYDFLKKKKIKFKYTGIDINKDFINLCKKKYKKTSFIKSHFLDYKIKSKPTYIIISGSLNLPVDDYGFVFLKIIKKMFIFSKDKCIFNLLVSSSKKIYKYNAYANMNKLPKLIDAISKFYIIDKSYLPHDISIVLTKK
jgi:SAM-dependent methyltransferase